MSVPVQYVVKAQCVKVTIKEGPSSRARLARKGDILPAGVDPVQLKSLVARGLVERTWLVEGVSAR